MHSTRLDFICNANQRSRNLPATAARQHAAAFDVKASGQRPLRKERPGMIRIRKSAAQRVGGAVLCASLVVMAGSSSAEARGGYGRVGRGFGGSYGHGWHGDRYYGWRGDGYYGWPGAYYQATRDQYRGVFSHP